MANKKGPERDLLKFVTDPGSDALTARLRYSLTGASRLAQDLPVEAHHNDSSEKVKAY